MVRLRVGLTLALTVWCQDQTPCLGPSHQRVCGSGRALPNLLEDVWSVVRIKDVPHASEIVFPPQLNSALLRFMFAPHAVGLIETCHNM